jgi:hypothetical protein
LVRNTQMLIKDEKITKEKACLKTFSKATNTIYAEQIETTKQIELAYKTKHSELIQNLENAKLNYQKESELVLSENSSNKNTLSTETIWKEQINAIKRNDFESFRMLETIHQENDIPRPNNVYSHLQSLEHLKSLEARQAKFKLFNGTESKNIVVRINKNVDGQLKVTDFRISNKIKLEESKPFNQNDLSYFVDSKKKSNANLNLHQILKNEPNLKIVETVYNYAETNVKLELLENLAQESLSRQSSKNEAAIQTAENLNFLATTINKAVSDEELLRSKLSENNSLDITDLQKPGRAFTKTELNQITNLTIELGDTELLGNRLTWLSQNKQIAQEIDQTPERIMAKTLVAQAENAESASKAIENFRQINENEIEVEINAVQLLKTGYQVKTSNQLENYLSTNTLECFARFKPEEISQANEIIRKNLYLQESYFEIYIKEENCRFGKEVSLQLHKPYTAEDLKFLNDTNFNNDSVEKFTQTALRNTNLNTIIKETEDYTVKIPT